MMSAAQSLLVSRNINDGNQLFVVVFSINSSLASIYAIFKFPLWMPMPIYIDYNGIMVSLLSKYIG